MSEITVLLTHPDAGEFAPFAHGGKTFIFGTIGSQAPKKLLDGPVWIFIDWVLEDLAGLELCRRLRADAKMASAHITMVLDDNDVASRKRALEAGADDYMQGPITRQAALDRILARDPALAAQNSANRLEFGPLVINIQAYRAYWNDTVIEVTPIEFRLLRLLAENANRTLSRREIVDSLGKDEEDIHERTVDVWIGRLRKAIMAAGGGNPLRTVRYIGYVLDL